MRRFISPANRHGSTRDRAARITRLCARVLCPSARPGSCRVGRRRDRGRSPRGGGGRRVVGLVVAMLRGLGVDVLQPPLGLGEDAVRDLDRVVRSAGMTTCSLFGVP